MLKIIFEFIGGPNDGKALQGILGDGGDAESYYFLTNHGAKGQRFKVASEYAVETLAEEQLKEEKRHHFQQHFYIVTDRLEEADELLIRSEYIEPEHTQNPDALVRAHLEPSSKNLTETFEEIIQRLIQQTAKSLEESFSQYWPADEESRNDPAESNLSLHLAHALLNKNYSVFAEVYHPHESIQGRIDILGFAPSQDWFLACELKRLYSMEQLQLLLYDIHRLEKFWLNTRLSSEACGPHIVHAANNCQTGYGLVAGLHWMWEEQKSTKVYDFWSSQQGEGPACTELAQKLKDLQAEWPKPLPVKNYQGRGTYYLLYAFFRIPR